MTHAYNETKIPVYTFRPPLHLPKGVTGNDKGKSSLMSALCGIDCIAGSFVLACLGGKAALFSLFSSLGPLWPSCSLSQLRCFLTNILISTKPPAMQDSMEGIFPMIPSPTPLGITLNFLGLRISNLFCGLVGIFSGTTHFASF